MDAATRRGGHAVVIGASMGGLAAAAAVAPFYDRVTIIDHDTLPVGADHRRGVPQSKHAHGFQPGGLLAWEKLVPGIIDVLAEEGGRSGDMSANCGWHIGGVSLARAESGIRGMGLTRPFVEHVVRQQVAALPGVQVRDRTDVVRPLFSGRTVAGVQLEPRDGSAGEVMAADLVVDATGRVSKLPAWLADHGLPVPQEERVQCRMAYMSRRWRLTNDVMGDDVTQVVTPAEEPVFGAAIAQEDGTWIITLGGLLGRAPTHDDAAYTAFALALPLPRIGEALDGAVPVTDYQPSHFPYSRRYRYDRLREHASGLIALGDSIASFNPMYGQGMTVAAQEAVALRGLLERGPLDTRRFYRRAHKLEDVAWKISTSGDLRFGEVEGRRTPDMKVMNAYLDRLVAVAATDPELAHLFLRVAGFIDRPEAFFKPGVVWRVARGPRARNGEGGPPSRHLHVPHPRLPRHRATPTREQTPA